MKDENPKKKAEDLLKKAYKLQMSGQLEDALMTYQASIEIYPTAEAYTFLGWTLSFGRRYDEAIGACRKAIELDPDYGNPYNDIGAYLIEMGRYEESVEWLQKAIAAKRYESYCYPHYNLGRVFEKRGEWMKALRYYDKALELKSDYLLAERARNQLRALLN